MGKKIGFLVFDSCEDWEQALTLRCNPDLPPGGILEWRQDAATVFPSRSDARAAIRRTEHYRLAFGRDDLPERSMCKLVPVEMQPGGRADEQ